MKRIKIIQLILSVFLLIIISCSEDWLKPDPLSILVPENVFVDEAGFESGLTRCRKEMNAENHGLFHPTCLDHMASDLAVPWRDADFRVLSPSSFLPTGGSIQYNFINTFTNEYKYIKNANIIISRIDNIEWTDQSIRNRILSEAYWFRAYWYYRLVNTYGDVPWAGKEETGAKLDYFTSSRWAILTKLEKDLEFARENLPVTTSKLGNVTLGAVNHLLAKVYLANCEFDKAITAASDVINGPYALMTERFGSDANKEWHNVMWDLSRCENKNIVSNTETIYATVDRADAPPATWWDNPSTYSMILYCPAYWKVKDADGQRATNWNSTAGDSLGNGAGCVRTNDFWHYQIWEDANYTWETTPDLRRANTNWVEMGDDISEILTLREGSSTYGQPLSKLYYGTLLDTVDTWYSWPLYKTWTPTPNYFLPRGGQGDWYIFRLAETYLLRAEAYYWKGQLGLAANDINMVRQRAHAPLITVADVDIEYIFDERARELYTEEPRHAEMVRVSFIFGKLNKDGYSLSNISDKNWYFDRVMRVNLFYSSPLYSYYGIEAHMSPHNMLWPISHQIITANTLGRINQNIGYPGADQNIPPLETIQ
jgi:starch-binding outer membrane protein, SusD/RagB family